jgi:hypothetical protein
VRRAPLCSPPRRRTGRPQNKTPGAAGKQLVGCPRNDTRSCGVHPRSSTTIPEGPKGVADFWMPNRTEYLTKLRTMFLTGELPRPIRRRRPPLCSLPRRRTGKAPPAVFPPPHSHPAPPPTAPPECQNTTRPAPPRDGFTRRCWCSSAETSSWVRVRVRVRRRAPLCSPPRRRTGKAPPAVFPLPRLETHRGLTWRKSKTSPLSSLPPACRE